MNSIFQPRLIFACSLDGMIAGGVVGAARLDPATAQATEFLLYMLGGALVGFLTGALWGLLGDS